MHEEDNSLGAVLCGVKVAHMVNLPETQHYGKLQQYVENLLFHIQQTIQKSRIVLTGNDTDLLTAVIAVLLYKAHASYDDFSEEDQ